MSERVKYLIKNTGILTISNFASKIMIFLLVPIYTRALTTAEYGIYDLVFSTIQLLFPLLTLNIVAAVMRFTMDKAYSIDDIAQVGLQHILMSFLPIAVFLGICSYSNMFQQIDGLEWIIFLYFVFFTLNQFFIQFAKGLEKVKEMGIAGILSTVILLTGTILCLFVLTDGLRGFFIANVSAQAVSCLYFSLKLSIWKYIKLEKVDGEIRKMMLLYSLPLIFTTLSWWVNNTADRYIVAFICGAAANGILSVAYKIPSILNTVQQIFVQAWQISAIKEYGNENTDEFYGQTFTFVNFVLSIGCASLIVLSKPLAHLLYANDFFVAWKYVPFLLIASAMNSASGLIGPILLAKKDTHSMAKSAIYGAVVNIVLNIALVYLWGIQGAAIATAISSYVIYAVRKRAAKDKIVINDYWKVILTWAILCVQALVEIWEISYGYGLEIIFIGIILWLNKDYIVVMKRYLSQLLAR